MANRDGVAAKKIVRCIQPVSVSSNTTTVSAIVDRRGFDKVSFVIVGDIANGTYTPLVNESDASNMAGETAVADANLITYNASAAPLESGQEAFCALTSSKEESKLGYLGNKRYLTCDIVSTGTATAASLIAVYAILESSGDEPVAG